MVGEKKQSDCTECNSRFEYEPIVFNGREMIACRICPECSARRSEAIAAEQESERRSIFEEKWRSVCPPLYRTTDAARISKECVEAVSEWNERGTTGLGFIGETGLGKTRALFLALRKAHDSGKGCAYVSHNWFSRTVLLAFSGNQDQKRDNMEELSRYRNCGVLLFDDIGKPPPTERADAELEELVEHRTSYHQPILWSANSSSTWLEQRLGADRGAPLVRRLSEFSTVITL